MKKVNWPQFDNERRFTIWSNGDGQYTVRDESGAVVYRTVAADMAMMKANDLNRGR